MLRRHRGGVEVYFYLFLISALDGGGLATTGPDRFTFGKKLPCPLYSRLGGLRMGMDGSGEEKICCSQEVQTLNCPARSVVSIPSTLLRPCVRISVRENWFGIASNSGLGS